jgi:hypothetical protein
MFWLWHMFVLSWCYLQCRCDFQLASFYFYFDMSCCVGPYFSCCGWRVGVACDHWWLFSLLWLLYLGHMCIDLPCYLSGLCLSCGVSKLNWWNLMFSTSGRVNVFCWVWCLIWFTLVWEGACDSPQFQGEYCHLSLRNLEFWLLPSWVGKLMFAIHMTWFEGELMFYSVYYIFCFSLVFSSYSTKSPCFTCYTSLYLLDYTYHCARMSSNEMWNFFARPC